MLLPSHEKKNALASTLFKGGWETLKANLYIITLCQVKPRTKSANTCLGNLQTSEQENIAGTGHWVVDWFVMQHYYGDNNWYTRGYFLCSYLISFTRSYIPEIFSALVFFFFLNLQNKLMRYLAGCEYASDVEWINAYVLFYFKSAQLCKAWCLCTKTS